MSNLPQQNTINQYLADGITSVYNYSFLILSATASENDISVYVTPSGQAANPQADLQILNDQYTVQNVGNVSGGTVTFLANNIPPISSIVTIVRTMSVSIDTEFAQAQNFNGANLDNAFERVVLIMQQLNTYYMNNALSYIINSYLPNVGSNFLPLLTTADNQIWISQGGKVIAVVLEENPDVSTLRSELASEVQNGDGASLIGYYDQQNNQPTTVAAFLNNSPRAPNGNMIIGGDMTTNPFQRGTTFTSVGNQYVADRFKFTSAGGGTVDSSRANDSPTVAQSGFFGVNSIKLAVNTPDTSIVSTSAYRIQYVIEGYDFTWLAQRSFTLSFWVKGNLPGIYCVSFSSGGTDRSYVAQYSIAASNVWQYVSITVPASPSGGTWNYTNLAGLIINFTLAAGSNFITTSNSWNNGYYFATAQQVNAMSSNTNTFQIDRVKIEPGNFATAWQARSIQEELSLCQRYYAKTYAQGVNPQTITDVGCTSFISSGAFTSGTNLYTEDFPVPMCTLPAVSIYSPRSGILNNCYDINASTGLAVTAANIGDSRFTIDAAATFTANHVNIWHYVANADF